MHFQVELRFRIGKLFPSFADLPRLLFGVVLGGATANDGARLQRGCGPQDTVPEIVGRNHRQAYRFPALLRHGKRLRKQVLLDAAEKLVGIEFVFAGGGAPQQSHVQNDNVAAAGLDAVQNVAKVVEVEVVADGHENVSGTRSDSFRTQLAFEFQVELIHLDASNAAMASAALGNGEHDVQNHRKNAAGHGRDRLGEKVHDGDQEQSQRNQSEPHGDLHTANRKVQRNLELALPRTRVAQYKNGEAVHREAPDDAEGVKIREESHIAAANENSENLQTDDDIDDAIAGAEARVRLAKPFGEHAIFRNAIQHSVGADDSGVHGPGKDECAHDYDEAMKNQADDQRSLETHGQAANQVLQIVLADIIGNDHHGEKGNQRGEHEAVNENDQPGLLQVGQLGAFNFAVNLGERLFSAHGQHGVAERNEGGHDAKHVRQTAVRQPAESVGAQAEIARIRKRRQGRMPKHRGIDAPADEKHNHDGDQLHDVQGFFARFRDAFSVFPPKIESDNDGETHRNGGDGILREGAAQVRVLRQ